MSYILGRQDGDPLPSGFKDVTREDIDNALHDIEELAKRWGNRLTFETLALTERYLKGEVSFAVVIDVSDMMPSKYVAVFKRKDLGRFVLPSPRKALGVYEGVRHPREVGDNGNYCSVFVENIHAIQLEQVVVQPSSVGLHRFDEFFNVGTDAPEKLRKSFARETRIPIYWEVGFRHYSFSDWLDIGLNNERHGQRIKRRHEIVDSVADDPREIGQLFDAFEPQELETWFRLHIQNDAAFVCTVKRFQKRIKVCNVLVGPVDLYPATQ